MGVAESFYKYLTAEKDPDIALSKLYEVVDDHICVIKNFNFVNELLSLANPEELRIDLSLGLIIITYAQKDKIEKRTQFYQKANGYFNSSLGEDRTGKILGGLE